MSGTIFSGSYLTGVTLTNTASNPVTVASSATIGNTGAPAIAGPATVTGTATVNWTITNDGKISATGSTISSAGISLGGGGTITNEAQGSISGYSYGVKLGAAGSVSNSGSIGGAGKNSIGVLVPGGQIINNAGGTITAGYIGAFMTKFGSADNAGFIHSTGGYALGGIGAASVTNEATGTITSANVGIALTGAGTVTNSGSVGSTSGYVQNGGDKAGIDLRAGGSVTNLSGGRVTAEWKGVSFGARGTSLATASTISSTLTNSGYVFAGNGSNAGAAVWMHTNGVILNESGGTITGGPYGIVAYYNTTVVNQGVIGSGGPPGYSTFAVFEANAASTVRVEMAPGARFTGTVEGGASGTGAAMGTLELLAGANAGSLTGFGTQFVNFAAVQIDAGANWSLAGTVAASQTVAFAGSGQLSLTNPTAMQGTVVAFDKGDSLVLAGITGVTSAVVNGSDQLVITAGTSVAATLQLDPSRHDPAGTAFRFVQTGGGTEIVACFAAGTRIATDTGEVPVEALTPGMRVRSPFGGTQPVVWTGHRRTDCRRHQRPHDVQPVRVQAGAFGPGQPVRDLWLSPDHAVFVSGVLIPVRYLVNGRSIVQLDVDAVTYWHVELQRHDVLLAEGLACESYLDTGNRSAFANGGGATMLHPDFALQVWQAQACAALVREGQRLVVARQGLLIRAVELGHTLTSEPDVTLTAGPRLLTIARTGGRYRAAPAGGQVRLACRAWVPAHTRPNESDTRTLGVAIKDIVFNGAPIALDDPRLTTGWHAPEAAWRWTDGDAMLELEGCGTLAFTVALAGTYWTDEAAVTPQWRSLPHPSSRSPR